MKRWIIQGILFVIGFIAVERFCHEKTHGFRIQKIQADLPHNSDWETLLPGDHEIRKYQTILSQPYYFLASGGESYVFISEDGKYVLKFFKLHHMRPKALSDAFLPSYFSKKVQRQRLKKLSTLFSSCLLAYERFRDKTGLIYIHLNKTDMLHTNCKILDAIGVKHLLSLDEIPFALQERAMMAYPTLSALADAREFDAAKKRLESLIDLIVARCAVGLSDHDARKRNFGFVGEKAVEIDIGSFAINEMLKTPYETKKVLMHETLKLRRYVKKRHPELLDFLDEKLHSHLDQ